MNATVEELKNTVIPGKSTRYKVRHLIENYPHFGAKEMAEVLGVSVQSIYSAKFELKRDGLTPKPLEKPKEAVPATMPTPQPEPVHIDVWDQYEPANSIETPFAYEEQYSPSPPVYIQPPPQTLGNQGAEFEINTAGADGTTVKSLVSVLYSKINDNRKYKVHVKIVEE